MFSNDEWILLLLRGAAALCLLAFWLGVVWYLRRDLVATRLLMASRRRAQGRLVVLNGNHTTLQEHALITPVTLGRAPGNTIQINDATASNEHARVIQRQGQWWLEDRQSSNGTHLNGVLVEEPMVLSSGDIIGIGDVQIRLELLQDA